MKSKKRKAGYNPKRHSYMRSDGCYVYEFWDSRIHAYKETVLHPGKDNVTEKIIEELDESDYLQDKNDNEQEELRDKRYDTYLKNSVSLDVQQADPLDIEFYKRFIHQAEEVSENSLIELVAGLICTLEPQQIEFYYQFFGEMKQYQEIADMDNVTRQAVYGRCKRFIEKMKKLLIAQGIAF